MGEIDRQAIEQVGLPGRLLMENAGRSVACAIRRRYPEIRRPLVVCGAGNNGGDGFVVARVLHEWDRRVRPVVAALGDPGRRSEEARANFALVASAEVECVEVKEPEDLDRSLAAADLVVDAIFGVGLARPVEGLYADVLRRMAGADAPRVALDVPSTLSSDTGESLGPDLDPELIVTLGLPKLGLVVRPLAAEIVVADLGLPRAACLAVAPRQHVLTPQAARARLPARPAGGHKGTFGHVLVVAGSTGKTGAAALAARGAVRTGAGLVTVAVPASLNPVLEVKLTEAMTLPVAESVAGALGEAAADVLVPEAAARSAAVVGPGLGTDPGTVRAIERLLDALERPAVVDADALNAFAGRPEALRARGARVLTPHPGEMARLLGASVDGVQRDRIGAARKLASAASAVVVYKGPRSVIAGPDGQVFVNPTGGPGLATGGTGDVLAGALGALLAQGLSPLDAAALGAYLHGLAGDLAPAVGGAAGGVAERIPDAWDRLAGLRERSDEPGVVRHFP
jgi:NAD(P)H-hydrate epimerase